MTEEKEWDWNCMDCGWNTAGHVHSTKTEPSEFYMVYNYIWEQATRDCNPQGMLCVGCLEARLERQLTAMDFDPGINGDGGVNHLEDYCMQPRSQRLTDRLTS